MKDFRIILQIIPILLLIGCSTTKEEFIPVVPTHREWPQPRKPEKRPVKFESQGEGLYLDPLSSSNLLFNIDELDIYIDKMENLVEEMQRYYNRR